MNGHIETNIEWGNEKGLLYYCNLREWIDTMGKENELARIKVEVDWNLELRAIARKNINRGGPA
jgi:3-polyprenyl-4-hydroxybenzoate decarboxylase